MTRRTVHLVAELHITATDKRHVLALVDKDGSADRPAASPLRSPSARETPCASPFRAGKATTSADG